MERKKRILQIAGGFRVDKDGKPVSGGIVEFIHNYYTVIDKTKYHFDFLAIKEQCFEKYRTDFEQNGSRLFCLKIDKNGLIRAMEIVAKLTKLLKKEKYYAIHINISSFFAALSCAIAGKLSKTKIIIVHSHSTGIYSPFKRNVANFFAPLLGLCATEYCTCSAQAAGNLFSKSIVKNGKYTIIKNAINVDRFKFNEKIRTGIRKELNICEKEIVLGHAGRFVEVKNHEFLLEVFMNLKKRIPQMKLLLVGSGPLMDNIKEKIDFLKLSDFTIFTGEVQNVEDYYQAMDLFCLPSLVEGFGIAALEAQCSGLPCFVSLNVPEEVKADDSCFFFDLNDGAEKVAELIYSHIYLRNSREDISKRVALSGYSLEDNVKEIEKLYE